MVGTCFHLLILRSIAIDSAAIWKEAGFTRHPEERSPTSKRDILLLNKLLAWEVSFQSSFPCIIQTPQPPGQDAILWRNKRVMNKITELSENIPEMCDSTEPMLLLLFIIFRTFQTWLVKKQHIFCINISGKKTWIVDDLQEMYTLNLYIHTQAHTEYVQHYTQASIFVHSGVQKSECTAKNWMF